MNTTLSHDAGEQLAAAARADIDRLDLSSRLTVLYVRARRTVRLQFSSASVDGFDFPAQALQRRVIRVILEGFARQRPGEQVRALNPLES